VSGTRALTGLAGTLARAVAATELSVTISDPHEPDNALVYVNAAFERMTGYRAADVIGRNCRLLQGDATDQAAVDQLRQGIAEERPVTATVLNYRRDGSSFWNEVSVSPVRGEDGAVTHFVGVQRDVSDRVVAERARELQHAAEQEARAEAEAAQARLAYLAQASATLDVSLDVPVVLERLRRLVVPRFGEACFVLGGVDAEPGPGGARDEDVPEAERAAVLARFAAVARAAGRLTILTADGGEGAVAAPDELRVLGAHAAIAAPLLARGSELGTLVVPTAGVPSEAELLLLSEVARRGAVALEQAHRFRERDHIARALQASLLPASLPELPRAELATRYVPSGSGAEVGGDFYDVFDTGVAWGVVIGDVCGKGPDAAAVTGLARHTVRAAAMQRGGPADVLDVLNRSLLRAGLGERFVTAAYADFRPTDDGAVLRLALGGHPRPVLVGADGGTRAVGRSGTLLGVLEDVALQETVVPLAPGDAVVLVTDGVLEAPGPGGRLEEGALLEVLTAAGGQDADGLADAVVARVLEHSGGAPADDIAVVAIRVR
jgi:PAS domain S-box-containing protein